MAGGVCACGCGKPVKHHGLEPRFASLDGTCQQRWLAVFDVPEPPAVEPVVRDEPVTEEERAEVRAELDRRRAELAAAVVVVVPLEIRPQPRSLWRFATGLLRKVV